MIAEQRAHISLRLEPLERRDLMTVGLSAFLSSGSQMLIIGSAAGTPTGAPAAPTGGTSAAAPHAATPTGLAAASTRPAR